MRRNKIIDRLDAMSKFRHDFGNYMQTVYELIDRRAYSEAEEAKVYILDNARLCIVLSNLIDNAIRACRELTESSAAEHKPFISLKVNEQFGYFVIRQENSFNGIVENRRSGAFSEHGLGDVYKNTLLKMIHCAIMYITDGMSEKCILRHDVKAGGLCNIG